MEFVTTLVGMVASGLAMAALYRLFPPRMQDYLLPPGTTLESLTEKYYKLELGLSLIYIVAYVAWIPIVYWVFRNIADAANYFRATSEVLLTPLWFVWYFPAALAAVFLSGVTARPVVKRILGDREMEYRAYSELRVGRIARLNFRHMYIVCFLPSLFVFYLFVDTYVIFRSSEIVIDPLTRIVSRRYAYSDIDRILAAPSSVAPNGSVHAGWRFVLYFHNGDRWNCRWDPSGRREDELKDIAQFVSDKSGIPIETIPVMQRVDQ